jgi:hypothetical protein
MDIFDKFVPEDIQEALIYSQVVLGFRLEREVDP